LGRPGLFCRLRMPRCRRSSSRNAGGIGSLRRSSSAAYLSMAWSSTPRAADKRAGSTFPVRRSCTSRRAARTSDISSANCAPGGVRPGGSAVMRDSDLSPQDALTSIPNATPARSPHARRSTMDPPRRRWGEPGTLRRQNRCGSCRQIASSPTRPCVGPGQYRPIGYACCVSAQPIPADVVQEVWSTARWAREQARLAQSIARETRARSRRLHAETVGRRADPSDGSPCV